MARGPRLKGEALYHHIYAWGNDRNPIFKSDSHYEKYLEYLASYASRYSINIIAYGLMEWHIHLFLFDSLGKLSQFMNNLHGRYAQFFNRVTKRVRHVFGERFNNKIVQVNNYGLWLSRYIHRQAVETGIVNDPIDYPWTSYRAYIGLTSKGFLKPGIILEQFGQGKVAFRQYEEFIMGEDDGPINWAKTTGSIIGDKEFIETLKDSKEENKEKKLNNKDLIENVSKQLHIRPELLLNPQGWPDRRLRHQAFAILVNKYGISATEVARAFKVSPMAVIKALKK